MRKKIAVLLHRENTVLGKGIRWAYRRAKSAYNAIPRPDRHAHLEGVREILKRSKK